MSDCDTQCQIIGGGWGVVDPRTIGTVIWHLLSHERQRILSRRELAIHGEYILEGELTIDHEGRMRVET